VHNVETLANVALIARYGAEWFRQLGTAEAPGTCLVTVSGGVERPRVLEVEIGTPIEQIIDRASPNPRLQASLVGGYGGSWLSGSEMATPYSPAALKSLNASMGAGVLVALPSDACGLRETARIVRFMADESAGQCGPCLFGVPALAEDLRLIADGRADQQTLDRLLVHCSQVSGRGACRHPDGVVRLVESAVRVFALDLAVHLAGQPCSASMGATMLSFPNLSSQRNER
jgi:NADH:ubiquinone oxidoreductase subunit F (NADH-binding)